MTGYFIGLGFGFFFGALLMGQAVGWWARRRGAAYLLRHLEVTKP